MINKCYKCSSNNLKVITRKKDYNVKGKLIIEIEEKILTCMECGEKIFDNEIEKENLEVLYDKYRKKKELLGPQEIIKIRESYNLSQTMFAKILGISEKAIERYEKNTIIDEIDNKTIVFASKPENMKKLMGKYE